MTIILWAVDEGNNQDQIFNDASVNNAYISMREGDGEGARERQKESVDKSQFPLSVVSISHI